MWKLLVAVATLGIVLGCSQGDITVNDTKAKEQQIEQASKKLENGGEDRRNEQEH